MKPVGESHGQDFWLLMQRLGDGAARVHVDIHTDDLAAEVDRPVGLGAERVQRVHSWQVMRDPAGLLFCVIPDPVGTLGDGNAHRWEGCSQWPLPAMRMPAARINLLMPPPGRAVIAVERPAAGLALGARFLVCIPAGAASA